jgi:hypothetical protein
MAIDPMNNILIIIRILFVVTLFQQIGSDELPIFPWDPGVHLVSRLFHLMMAQVAPKSNILHSLLSHSL